VTYSRPEGLSADGSNPLFVDSGNRLWFPPADGGLWWMKDERHGRLTNDGLDRDVVYSLAGGSGELWIGRQQGGLTRLRYDKNPFETRTWTHADGLAQDSVYSVYVARDGTVWAGTLSAGVSMLKDGRFTNFTMANGLASNTIASILEGSGGTMWFATPSGLSALSDGGWRTYTTSDGLPSENVNCLFEDSHGVIWAGTAAGLAFLGNGRFQLPASPALLRAPILGLAEDRHGSLWIATSNDVLRVDREKLLRSALGEGDVRQYGLADGLRGVEGVKRNRSVVSDAFGRIWFSLNRGISVVDPGRLSRESAPAITHVQSISVDGQPVPIAGAIHIGGGGRRMTFSYAGLSLSVPERVRYRYLLEGFDRDWGEPTPAREAVYTNLAPGSYRFRLVASNPDGVWSGEEANVAFQVNPLFWQTWWFRLSIPVVLGIAAAGLYRLRLRQHTRRLNLRFEERLGERTRIAQEIHDTLLQGFLSVSMQVHVAADSLPADSRVKPILTRVLLRMGQVIEEGRNAVRGLRSPSGASLDLAHAFSRIQQDFGAQPGENAGVEFRVVVEGQQVPLHPLLRDEVYKIGREAVINALRHSRANHIEVELRYKSSQFLVFVRDDGSGIDPKILQTGRDGHWGLSGMRERAERLGAQLHVLSSASAGTEIELCVPGHLAFENQPRRRRRWFGGRVGGQRRTIQ
jgi:signal transduction histidine kinase/streptogramin lyase